jgi:hypothetical protein
MKVTICTRRVLFLCLAGIGATFATGAPARAQAADDRLERILAAWQERQQAFKGIRYTVTGTHVRPKGSITDPMTGQPLPGPEPSKDITEPKEYKLLLDFSGKRFRLDLTEQLYSAAYRQLEPRASTSVFDDHDLFTLRPRSANSNASIPWEGFDVMIGRNLNAAKGTLGGTITASLGPLLCAHGLVPRWTRQPDFDMKLEAKDFQVHGQGVQDGRACAVVRTVPHETFFNTTFDEYWVDPERDGAILRYTIYQNEKPLVDEEVSWQATPQGWLPQRWTRTTWMQDRIDGVSRLEVVDFEADPAVTAADFRVSIEPGMDVRETTIGNSGRVSDGGTKVFRVRADGGWNEVVNGVEIPSRSWAPFYWGAALAAVVLGLVLWHLRRRARGRTPPPTSGRPGLQML